ncbi:MAG: hypothetical protein JWR10_3800 [Rubritepida sp.]|nr:hypothetical protein [Rubritepida sp.]
MHDVVSRISGIFGRSSGPDSHPRLTLLAWLVAAAALAHAGYILVGWLNDPLLDQHPFRQTQTALSTYWIMQGGPILAYDTPIVGSPWAIPFEAAVYQCFVAVLALLGVPLDAAGRIVSFAFLLAAAWPLRMLWRDLNLPPVGYPMACALLLASPLYLFWGRTFMIESCAWFFALLWLAFFVRFLQSGRVAPALVAILAGCLAILAKATTFPGFALVGGLIGLWYGWQWLREAGLVRLMRRVALAGAAMFLPFVVGLAWVSFSDAAKSENPFGRLLTSAALGGWNYGTMAQRFSAPLWQTAVAGRMLPDIFGVLGAMTLVLLLGAVFRPRGLLAVGICLLGFLVPILVFTNLHIVHNYYQYANGAFLLVALAIALGSLPRMRFGSVVAGALLVVVVGSQAAQFRRQNVPWMSLGSYGNGPQQIGLMARANTPEDGSLLIFGEDWSSTVAYYSRRRSFALPYWTPPQLLAEVLQDPQSHLTGTRLSGIVDCMLPGPRYSALQAEVDAFVAGRRVIGQAGHCRLLSMERD